MEKKPDNSRDPAGEMADLPARNAEAVSREPAGAPQNAPGQDGALEEAVVAEAECVTKQGNALVVKEEVFLRIYDLSQGAARVLSKQMLGFELEGIWHTSIEAYGNEYYFQNGLIIQTAGTTRYGAYVKRISLGHTDCSKMSLEEYFELSRHMWKPESYDLFENNCNNFSNYLADFLVQKGIPSYILELPGLVKQSPAFKQLFGMKKD